MHPRIRKLIGTILLLTLVIVYSLVAMVVGSSLLARANLFWQTIIYLVTGLAWVPAAMWIISWMHRGDVPRQS